MIFVIRMFYITIMTIIVYLLANTFTYQIGTKEPCGPPLKDVMHDILPDCSNHVHIRDIILILFFIPILFINKNVKTIFIEQLWYAFMIIVLIKAVCIFFTYIPSSFPYCGNNKYLNHCHHIQVSGHASLCLILAFFYIKYNIFTEWVYVIVFLYSIIILLTRAHYTFNVIEGLIITWLVLN